MKKAEEAREADEVEKVKEVQRVKLADIDIIDSFNQSSTKQSFDSDPDLSLQAFNEARHAISLAELAVRGLDLILSKKAGIAVLPDKVFQ